MKATIYLAAALTAAVLATPALSQYGDNRDGPGQYDNRGYGDRGRDDDRGRGGRSAATFYVQDGFGGRSVTVDRPIRSFREFDMNDKVSSIRLRGGPWLVCVDDDFRGRCQVINRSIDRLDRIGMDDAISSARPMRGGDTYRDPNAYADPYRR